MKHIFRRSGQQWWPRQHCKEHSRQEAKKRTAEEHVTSQSSSELEFSPLRWTTGNTHEKGWSWEPTSACVGHTGGAPGKREPCGADYSRSCDSNGPCGCTAESLADRGHCDEECGGNRWLRRHLKCGHPDRGSSSTLVTGLLCMMLMRLLKSIASISVHTKKKPRCSDWTEHESGERGRRILAARWIGKRSCCLCYNETPQDCKLPAETAITGRLLGHSTLEGLSFHAYCVMENWESVLDQHTLKEVSSQPNTTNAPIAFSGWPRSQRCGAIASASIKVL